jgi:hypothetical protein
MINIKDFQNELQVLIDKYKNCDDFKIDQELSKFFLNQSSDSNRKLMTSASSSTSADLGAYLIVDYWKDLFIKNVHNFIQSINNNSKFEYVELSCEENTEYEHFATATVETNTTIKNKNVVLGFDNFLGTVKIKYNLIESECRDNFRTWQCATKHTYKIFSDDVINADIVFFEKNGSLLLTSYKWDNINIYANSGLKHFCDIVPTLKSQ